MPREDMPDVIVLLPGITGSRLRKNGETVWGFAASALGRALLTRGGALERDLTLSSDPLDQDDLGDGIVADELIPDLHLLPNLWKIDGYTRIMEMIQAAFNVEIGKNLFPFPYDWRRDNRVAARKLCRSCQQWLHDWRNYSGNSNARLILIAHSMGGLIARYFLECHEGWKDTRALITFGTPFRGSLNAVDTLANGMRKGPFGLIDLSRTARSFTSIYQLLPIYPCYDPGDGNLVRIGETSGIPNIDADRAAAALAFHREIEAAVDANRKLSAYTADGYKIYPIIGIAQSTNQSARLMGEAVELLRTCGEKDYGGDGTVPSPSAEPIEFDDDSPRMFIGTQHAALQNGESALTHIVGLINRFYFDLGGFRWGREGPGAPAAQVTRVDLHVPDLLACDEPLVICARPEQEDVILEVEVKSSSGSIVHSTRLMPSGGGFRSIELPPLAEDSYRVRVFGPRGGVEPAEDALAVSGKSPV